MSKMFLNIKINKFVRDLKNNKVVILPTETVYGFFVLAKPENMYELNRIKKAPLQKQLTVFFSSKQEALEYLNLSEFQSEIFYQEFPGSKTIIFNSLKTSVFFGENDNNSIGIRIPDLSNNIFLKKILEKTGPLFATSVNFYNKKELDSKNFRNSFSKQDVTRIYLGSRFFKKNIFRNKASTIIDIRNDKVKLIRKNE